MTSVSQTSIANMALVALGANIVTNIADDNTEGNIIKVYYDTARDAVLEDREWTFAIARATLAQLKEGPEWGPEFAFQIPSDTIRVLEVRAAVPTNRINFHEQANRLDWRREGNTIVCNQRTARMRYIRRVEDPLRFSSNFVYAFAMRLAYEACIAITQSVGLQEELFKQYQIKLAAAASTDGMQGRSEKLRASQLTGIRGIGSSVTDFQ